MFITVGLRALVQSQRCFLQSHVVRGLWARSVMLGSPHLVLATMTQRTTRSCEPQAWESARCPSGTVAVRASVRAWRMSAACMTTCIWLTFSWLTCSWLTCSDMIVPCSTRVSQLFSRSWGRSSCWGLTARGSVPCSCKRELHAAQAEAQRCGLGWTASRRFGGAASEGLGDSCSRVECRGSGGRSRCAGSALSV